MVLYPCSHSDKQPDGYAGRQQAVCGSQMEFLQQVQRPRSHSSVWGLRWLAALLLFAALVGLAVLAQAQAPVFVDRAASVGLIDAHGAEELPRFFETVLEEAYYVNHGSGGAVFDFDRDGDLDVIVAGYPGEPDRIWINQLAERGTLSFRHEVLPSSDAAWRRSIVVADFDGDGLLDLLLHGDGFDGAPGTILLLREPSSGWRQEFVAEHITEFAQTFSMVADLAGDGRPWILTGAWALQLPGDEPQDLGRLRLFRCGERSHPSCVEVPIVAEENSPLLQGNHYNAVMAELHTDTSSRQEALGVFVANDFQMSKPWLAPGALTLLCAMRLRRGQGEGMGA